MEHVPVPVPRGRPTSPTPQVLWLRQQEPTANGHTSPSSATHLFFPTRCQQSSASNRANNEGERQPQSRPEDVQVGSPRRGATKTGSPSSGRVLGTISAAFRPTLWPQLSCPGLSPQRLNVLQLWVPAQGAIKGMSSST